MPSVVRIHLHPHLQRRVDQIPLFFVFFNSFLRSGVILLTASSWGILSHLINSVSYEEVFCSLSVAPLGAIAGAALLLLFV